MSHQEQLASGTTPVERGQGQFNPETTFVSGEPGTHGREPFEDDSTFSGREHSGSHSGAHTGVLGGAHQHGGAGVGIDDHHHNSGLAPAGGVGGGVGDGGRFGQSGATAIDEATASSGTAETGRTRNEGTGLASAAHHATVGDHHKNHEGSGLGGNKFDSDRDSGRVGDLNQGGAMYERTGTDGPVTGGAAGTDRFDSDRDHPRSSGLTSGHDRTDNDENSRRREGGGTGGVGGILTTTDDEFIGRERKGGESGAYGDKDGPFKGNRDGPGGSALTGREGNFAQNAVTESRTRGEDKAEASGGMHTKGVNEDRTPVAGATGAHGHHGVRDEHETGEKKGLMEKIKDALH